MHCRLPQWMQGPSQPKRIEAAAAATPIVRSPPFVSLPTNHRGQNSLQSFQPRSISNQPSPPGTLGHPPLSHRPLPVAHPSEMEIKAARVETAWARVYPALVEQWTAFVLTLVESCCVFMGKWLCRAINWQGWMAVRGWCWVNLNSTLLYS